MVAPYGTYRSAEDVKSCQGVAEGETSGAVQSVLISHVRAALRKATSQHSTFAAHKAETGGHHTSSGR